MHIALWTTAQSPPPRSVSLGAAVGFSLPQLQPEARLLGLKPGQPHRFRRCLGG